MSQETTLTQLLIIINQPDSFLNSLTKFDEMKKSIVTGQFVKYFESTTNICEGL